MINSFGMILCSVRTANCSLPIFSVFEAHQQSPDSSHGINAATGGGATRFSVLANHPRPGSSKALLAVGEVWRGTTMAPIFGENQLIECIAS